MAISVRIVNLDHYMADPGPLDRSYTPFSDKQLAKVPVLRIFGSTKLGQKVCLHIHQVFPYFFVPYDIPVEYSTDQEIQKDIFQFGKDLNEAMDLARPQKEPNQHIAAIVLVKGVPFYGYHIGYRTYLKIYMTNPHEKHQMLEILQSGAIQNAFFQPHEAHVNFELQFFMDHNLYGMDWIHIEEHNVSPSLKIQFRLPLLDAPKAHYSISQSSMTTTSTGSHHTLSPPFISLLQQQQQDQQEQQQKGVYTAKTIPLGLQSNAVPKSSYCELELDITGMSIRNRHDLKERSIHTSLMREKHIQAETLQQHPEEESKKKLVLSLRSIWVDETNRRKSRGIKDPIPPVAQLDEREPREPWSAEPALRRLMETMMTGHPFDHESETQQPSLLMPKVMTVFEAIEALYPTEYFEYEASRQAAATEAAAAAAAAQVPSPSIHHTPSRIDDLSSIDLPSFTPHPPSGGTTPAQTSPHRNPNNNLSSHFNVSATPTRYRGLSVQSQLDKSIIHTFMEDVNSSFHQDDDEEPNSRDHEEQVQQEEEEEEEQENALVPPQDDDDDDDDEFEFSNQDSLRISDIARWLEETEREESKKRTKKHATQVIAYDEDDNGRPMTYRPRKLDIMAEVQKMDSLLATEDVHRPKKSILEFIEEDEDEEAGQDQQQQQQDEGQEKEESANQAPFQLSDSPPDPMARVTRSRRMKRRINQLDGSGDQQDVGSSNRRKRPRSAAERWEEEKQSLKKMRLKMVRQRSLNKEDRTTSSAPQPSAKERSATPPATAATKRAKSIDEIHPKGMQRVTVVISLPKRKKKSKKKKKEELVAEAPSPKQVIEATEPAEQPTTKHAKPKTYPEPRVIIHQHRPVDLQAHESNDGNEADSNVDPAMPETPPKEEVEEQDAKEPAVEATTSFALDQPLTFSSLIERFPQTQTISREFVYRYDPPNIHADDLPKEGVVYQEPFYSNPSDLPRFPTVFADKEFRLPTVGLAALKEFQSVYTTSIPPEAHSTIKAWSPSQNPPSFKQVHDWMQTEAYASCQPTLPKQQRQQKQKQKQQQDSKTQLQHPTYSNTFNFKFSASKPVNKVKRIRDYIDYFSLEIHVNTRDQLLPDPERDAVQLIFWCLQTEDLRVPSNGYQEGLCLGVIAMKKDFDIARMTGISQSRLVVDYADTEEELFSLLIGKIRHYDPDMLVGYEVQNASWGYLVERGAQLGYHLVDELSRVMTTTDSIKRDQWGYQRASVYRVTGRHLLNVWRMMKSELTLTSYTFENIAYNLLHDRVPHYSHATLTSWYTQGPAVLKYRLLKYYMKRVQLNLDMLDASQVVSRTCESARVYGIDFYAVLSRGSQYNVESIMFRIAKPENFVLITPSRAQVASQRSLEILPLIMEPISQFYSSPMVVLDFQSLYPSIMIAYNYCYSTCLGRIRKPGEASRFGVLPSFEPDDGLLDALKDYINVSPNGIMFVKPEIRKSLLAKMLSELLDTRVMIKRAMKDYKEDPGLLRILDAKQLTLKLLANVTYGYTSASFSGRMPSVEIADSIVATGRETLERSIRLINETEKWGARVVYGDTDSMFIYFPGKTKDEAFTLGNEIAETITKLNPAPVKLKFEKVYHPAVLLAKKRYVGFKYEHPSDTEPVFEAKGIETVRRDGTPATQKMLESCLKILFRTQDMSELKAFLYNQWTKILSNRVPLQDFIISKEVRMGTYSSRGGPNGALIAQAQMDTDARAEPQYGERVPYVVVYRGPNAKLKDKVVPPEQLLNDSSLRLDAEYYIRKQIIPPLSRVFNLMGVDILSWYESMPRSQKIAAMNLALSTEHQARNLTRIDQYYSSSHCIVCRKIADQAICNQCKQDASSTLFTLLSRQQMSQDKFRRVLQACQDCSKLSPLDAMTVVEQQQEHHYADVPCDSLDCPVFYERLKAKEDVRVTSSYDALIDTLNTPQN
ncbi:hypothetical protein MBANPS3_007546 [Mucor bainieri]